MGPDNDRGLRLALPAVAVSLAVGVAGALGRAIHAPAAPPPCEPKPAVVERALGGAPPRRAPPSFLERQEIATAEVEAALDAVKPQLAARCWSGPPSKNGMTVILQFSFDSTGCEVGRGIVEERGADPAVVECLRSVTDLPLEISAPGDTVDVQAVLTFP